MLSTGQVQGFVAGDQTNNFRVAFHQFTFGEGERAGEADIKADRFQRVHAHQAQIQLLLQLTQVYDNRFTINGMRAFTEQMPVAGHLDQFVVVAGDAFCAFLDLLVGDDIVKHHRRIVNNITDDVGVRAGVDRFRKRPRFHPGFQFRDRD